MATDQAVVVGCGFGGIAAAGVLARHFDRVTIIERDDVPDEVPDDGRPRKGVPQSPHVHGILKLGRDILDGIFPGFVADAEADGAPLFDFFSKGTGFSDRGWVVRGHSEDVRGFSIRRAVLEHLARRRAIALPNVAIEHGRVEGLTTNGRRRVTGVQLTEGTTIDDADLVVDCTGRTAQSPKWLEDAGFTPPAETVVNAFGGYASRYVHIPEDAWPSWWRYIAQVPLAWNTKGGMVYPQDDDFYVISLFGQSRDYPPGDEDGFDAFLGQCDVPMLQEMSRQAEPASEFRTSRATANRWRHFEDLVDPPVGYVALGDAASTFNPMNGQGVSTACYGALTLGEALVDLDLDVERLTPEFQRRLAVRMEFPWRQALSFDFKFTDTVGTRPAPGPNAAEELAYRKAIGALGTVDIEVARAASLSAHLLDPSLLQTPEIAAKVKAWIAGGHESPYTDPTVPPPSPDDPKWCWSNDDARPEQQGART